MNTQDSRFQQKYEKYDYCGINATKQMKANSCGPACLTSVLNYWKIDITEQDIMTEFPKSKEEGYSIIELKHIATIKGLAAYVFSMQENSIPQLKKEILKGRPAICATLFPDMLYFAYDVPIYGHVYRKLLWTFGPRKSHYVVVFGFNRNKFLIMDPIRGFVSISQKDFESCWKKKNYAMLLCTRKSSPP
jgi:ABC-type bacteriocin/lantibiotic exporter with double-glycine peptidase domain